MNGFSHTGLRIRLALLVAIAFLPILGPTYYAATKDYEREKEDAQREALRLARVISADQGRIIEGTHDLLAALSQVSEVRNLTPGSCTSLLARLLKRFPHYANVMTIDLNGKVSSSGIPIEAPIGVSAADWFKRSIRTADFVVGGYTLDPATRDPAIALGHPIVNESGRVEGVVCASLKLAWLYQSMSQMPLPHETTLTLLDNRGTILIRYPDQAKWLGRLVPESFIFGQIKDRPEGMAEGPGADGIPRFFGFVRVCEAHQGAWLSIGIPKSVALAGAKRMLLRSLSLPGFAALLTFGVLLFASEVFFVPKVGALMETSRRISEGDMDARTGLPYGKSDLGWLAKAFDEMAENLQRRQIESEELAEALRESERQLRSLSAEFIKAQENERKRIARELHDSIGQSLSAVKFGIQNSADRIHQTVPSADLSSLYSLVPMVQHAVDEVRKIMTDLRPSMLDDLGILATMSWFCREFQKIYTGIRVEKAIDVNEADIPEPLKIVIFRIMQEAMNNAAKHSGADLIRVSLTKKDATIEMIVADNGKGFEPAGTIFRDDYGTGFGLSSMRERTELSGGSFLIQSSEATGTVIKALWPSRQPAMAESDFHASTENCRHLPHSA